jgi:hypothetical protein
MTKRNMKHLNDLTKYLDDHPHFAKQAQHALLGQLAGPSVDSRKSIPEGDAKAEAKSRDYLNMDPEPENMHPTTNAAIAEDLLTSTSWWAAPDQMPLEDVTSEVREAVHGIGADWLERNPDYHDPDFITKRD